MLKRKYYDLEITLKIMNELMREDIVDGFEFQLLAEWNATQPPLDDPNGTRLGAWKSSSKYSVNQIALRLEEIALPIFSIHANRDIGKLLCSAEESEIEKGKSFCQQSMELAEQIEAKLCVFHIWDPLSQNFDIKFLQETLRDISRQFPALRASVENIPTSIPGCTPIHLLHGFKWITLDLRWAAMYNELYLFRNLLQKIINVHLRGEILNKFWVLPDAPFTFEEAINLMLNDWRYLDIYTLEPDGDLKLSNWQNLKTAIQALKK